MSGSRCSRIPQCHINSCQSPTPFVSQPRIEFTRDTESRVRDRPSPKTRSSATTSPIRGRGVYTQYYEIYVTC